MAQTYLAGGLAMLLYEDRLGLLLYRLWRGNPTAFVTPLLSTSIARQLETASHWTSMHEYAQTVHTRCMSYWIEALAGHNSSAAFQVDQMTFVALLKRCARNCTAATLLWQQCVGIDGNER
jgi:hypothetical protein